jgi:hypothetical protein
MDRRSSATLRAEARLLAVAGAILLGIGFLATIILVGRALDAEGASPGLPIWVGGPPLLFGYLSCHFATLRMQRARALDSKRRRARRRREAPASEASASGR